MPNFEYKNSLNSILEIFSIETWGLFFLSYLVLCALNCSMVQFVKFHEIVLNYFALIFCQAQMKKEFENRSLLFTWLFAIFLLTFLFKNDLLAKILTKKPRLINNLDELYLSGYQIFVVEETKQHIYLREVL